MPSELQQKEEVFWNAVVQRNSALDGQFYFGVMTTGVYCRPGCACRMPLRKNVRFFEDVASAEQAGLRACQRCRPNEASLEDHYKARMHEIADEICRHPEQALPLNQMAERASMSPFHFQRTFKAVMGVTPRQFLESCRVAKLKAELRADHSVTHAIYEAGFGSSSRVYEKVNTHLGMTPAQYRSGGKEIVIAYAAEESALGRMMVGATNRGICFIQFADSDAELLTMLSAEYPAALLQPMPEECIGDFQAWMAALHGYLAGEARHLDLPMDLRATAFQMKVWRYLQTIPYGSVKSYSEVAADLGQPTAARAVARACATNQLALLIPCHRVIRGNGDLAGYKWGLDRKRVLLDQERRSHV